MTLLIVAMTNNREKLDSSRTSNPSCRQVFAAPALDRPVRLAFLSASATPLGAACAAARGAGDGDARFGTPGVGSRTRGEAKFANGRVGVGRSARFRGLSIADRKRHRRFFRGRCRRKSLRVASGREERGRGDAWTRGLDGSVSSQGPAIGRDDALYAVQQRQRRHLLLQRQRLPL